MERVYLDNAASTPVRPEVLEAMLPYLAESCGNPSSVHPMGQEARLAVEKARGRVAALINADPSEIVFTSGASEANNLAIRGTSWAHAVTTALEHPSVGKTFRALGREVTEVKPGANGVVRSEDVAASVNEATGLVSVMLVSNEVGTVQPVGEISGLLGSRLRGNDGRSRPLFHVDAVQAPVCLDVDVRALDVDLMTLSAHKLGGPKGVGALYVRKGVTIVPQMTGGAHEMGFRAGTENVAGIVGFGAAAEALTRSKSSDRKKMAGLRERLMVGIAASGVAKPLLADSSPTHILSIEVPGAEADFLVMLLGRDGVMAASGSACSSGTRDSSPTLSAMGIPAQRAKTVLRVSFGWRNIEDDIDRFVEALQRVASKARI